MFNQYKIKQAKGEKDSFYAFAVHPGNHVTYPGRLL